MECEFLYFREGSGITSLTRLGIPEEMNGVIHFYLYYLLQCLELSLAQKRHLPFIFIDCKSYNQLTKVNYTQDATKGALDIAKGQNKIIWGFCLKSPSYPSSHY